MLQTASRATVSRGIDRPSLWTGRRRSVSVWVWARAVRGARDIAKAAITSAPAVWPAASRAASRARFRVVPMRVKSTMIMPSTRP